MTQTQANNNDNARSALSMEQRTLRSLFRAFMLRLCQYIDELASTFWGPVLVILVPLLCVSIGFSVVANNELGAQFNANINALAQQCATQLSQQKTGYESLFDEQKASFDNQLRDATHASSLCVLRWIGAWTITMTAAVWAMYFWLDYKLSNAYKTKSLVFELEQRHAFTKLIHEERADHWKECMDSAVAQAPMRTPVSLKRATGFTV